MPMALEVSQPAVGARFRLVPPEGREAPFGTRLLAGLWRYTPILILAALWEGVTRFGLISPLALPPLDEVMAAWWRLLIGGDLGNAAAVSLSRAAAGFGLAIAWGTTLGVLMAWFRPVRTIFNPLVQALYPMPKSALIPVVVLWLGFGSASKILMIFIGCMLPITLSAFNGARGIDRVLIWSARSLGAGRFATLTQVVIPGALPEILAGIRTAMAFAFVLLVATELIVARQGLGYMIGWLGDGGVYDAMFSVVLTVAVLGFLADRGYLLWMNWVLRWRG
jgi:NitT/TauT family transport system permease protein